MSNAEHHRQALRKRVVELYASSLAMTQGKIALILGIPEVLVAQILDTTR